MSPSYASDDAVNSREANAVLGAKLHECRFSGRIFGTNQSNQFISELGARNPLSTTSSIWLRNVAISFAASRIVRSRVSSTSLRNFVMRIVGLSPEPKMSRIDASPNIAAMADEQSFGNRTYPEFIGETVGPDLFVACETERSVNSRLRRWPQTT